MHEGKVRSARARRLALEVRDRLSHAWAAHDPFGEVAQCISLMIPEVAGAFMDWVGDDHATPRILCPLPGAYGSDADQLPWYTSGAALRERHYHPRRTYALANRVIDLHDITRLAPDSARTFRELALDVIGIHSFMRVTLYRGSTMVAFLGLGRIGDTPELSLADKLTVQSLVPELAHGLDARLTMQRKGLQPGGVEAIAAAMDCPAFIVAPGGFVTFANELARIAYPRYPDWIAACSSVRSDTPRPSNVKRIPLRIGDRRFFLLVPEDFTAPEDAPAAAWARRWHLAPRLARVAACMMLGMSDKQIAERLGMRFSTARTYAREVLAASGVHSRAALMRAARLRD